MTYVEKGFEVWCLTGVWGKENITKALSERNLTTAHVHYVELPQWLEHRYENRNGSAWIYLRYLAFQRRLYRIAKRLDKIHEFDLIHHVSWGSIQMGTSLWRLKKPFIFGPVGGGQFPPNGFESYFDVGWDKEVKRKKTSDLLLKFYPDSRATLKNASLVLTVNRETYRMAKNMGARHIDYFLDASVRADKIPPSLPTREASSVFRLTWVGRILPRKALPLTLEALSKVSPEVPVHMDIYGDGELGRRVPQWIEQYQVGDRVTWHGQVPWTEVFAAFQRNDVFIFNSLRESYGLQLMEAMASGIPIICLDLHGAGKFVPREAGIKVPVSTPEETVQKMAEAIEFMYRNPQQRLEAGGYAYQYAKQQGIFNKWAELGDMLQEAGLISHESFFNSSKTTNDVPSA